MLRQLVLSAVVAAAAASAQAVVVVPGTSDPYLAGQPDGASCCSGDHAPGQSPVLAMSGLTGGQVLTFSATGGATYSSYYLSPPSPTPDGDPGFYIDMSAYQDPNVPIAGTGSVPINALVGVFLGDTLPAVAARPSARDDGTTFLAVAPQIAQIFWIGDGLTGTGTGTVQQFTVPTGATRLFLGTVDTYEWNNDAGSITVTITPLAAAVPEPGSWAMMVAGFGLVGAAMRTRSKVNPRLDQPIQPQ